MTITLLQKENYLMMIRKSVGSRIFQTLIARDGNRKRDILKNGQLSCAAFVSWILHHFALIAEPHATVDGTIRDLKKSGWKKIRKPVPGAVLVWSGIRYPDGELHCHVGFFLGGTQAISNDSRTRRPKIHHWTFERRRTKSYRPLESVFIHPSLLR